MFKIYPQSCMQCRGRTGEFGDAQEEMSYNQGMARGWESKSVEAQIEESTSSTPVSERPAQSAQEVQAKMRKAALMLSRRRVMQELKNGANDRYSELLQRTLVDLDSQIAQASS